MGSVGQLGGLLTSPHGFLHRPLFAPYIIAPATSATHECPAPPLAVEKTMPESPVVVDSKLPPTGPVVISPLPAMPPVTSSTPGRPLSSSSSLSGMGGAGLHSPLSLTTGRTPSPPGGGGGPPGGGLLGGSASQQLPPACGARQLSKLKRFLTTLIQFGADMAPEIGERVRSLVLALVNNHLSIEEFHSKLQEATNFPLRPFVIPFLKANLPLLQRELLHCARMAKQSPQQYLAHNAEHILFSTAGGGADSAGSHSPPTEQHELSPGSTGGTAELNENGKRRSPDSSSNSRHKDVDSDCGPLHPAKRPHTVSPVTSSHSRGPPPPSPPGLTRAPHFHHSPRLGGLGLDDLQPHRGEMRDRHPAASASDTRHFPSFNFPSVSRSEAPPPHLDYDRHLDNHIGRMEDEWKHVENMLHCIMDMVGRCRRALTALQEKAARDREELAAWMRRHGGTLDSDVKKRADMMADSLRHTEDRVNEVRRRAVYEFPEEAVNEVKRQAVVELQKAVAAAENKASELVAEERAKMDSAIRQAKKEAYDEVLAKLNSQEESSESCWNCGRKANETCSGCNIARYCGAFCQHKDWESHHRVCGQPRPVGDNATTPGAPAASQQSAKAAAGGLPALDTDAVVTIAPVSSSSSSSQNSSPAPAGGNSPARAAQKVVSPASQHNSPSASPAEEQTTSNSGDKDSD